MEDNDDIYSDTISLGSRSSVEKNKEKPFMSLSRNTIYHSAEDMKFNDDNILMAETDVDDESHFLNSSTLNYSRPTTTKTYYQTWHCMKNGSSSVDFVLVSRTNTKCNEQADKRQIFETNLKNEGLELEYENINTLEFVKIHASREVLERYCEILKMKMPIKEIHGQESILDPSFDLIKEVKSYLGSALNFVKIDNRLFPEKKYQLTSEFSRDKKYLFNTDDPDFFNLSVRHAIIDFILKRQRFSDDETAVFDVGVDKLIADNVYAASYPLHDGGYRLLDSQRGLLFKEWASVSKWIRFQPIDYIKEYLGIKVAIYFAWLGFYTHMLIPASIVGLICFFYGLITMFTNTLSNDICKSNITMCPLCDAKCDYWELKGTCTYARISYLFDNNSTVFFALFMSFWATLYLELWKRNSAEITHRWGLDLITKMNLQDHNF